MAPLVVVPEYQPDGENGPWVHCAPAEAEAWSVWTAIPEGEDQGKPGDLLEMFDTKKEADAYVIANC